MRYAMVALVVAGFLVSVTASADVISIDFNSLVEGQILDDEYVGQGVTFSGINPNNTTGDPDLLTIYDSNEQDGPDPDLENPPDGWEGGNLAPSTDMGNLMILEENALDGNGDGIVDSHPDDEQSGGNIIMEFEEDLLWFGFSNVDSDGFGEQCCVTFHRDGVMVGQVFFFDRTDSSSYFYDPTIAYGNDFANQYEAVYWTDPNENVVAGSSSPGNGTGTIGKFNEVRFNLGGSGGFDDLRFQTPEPGTMALLGLGLAAFGAYRRRKGDE